MAKLPTASQIDRPIPQARQSVVSYTPSGGQGLQIIGKTLGDYADKMQEEQDKLDISYATADYLQRRIAAEKKATEGDDYTSYLPKYQSLMAEEQKQAASKIRRNSKRAQAEAAFALDTAQSLSGIQNQADAKYKDVVVAGAFEQGQKLSESYQSTQDPITRLQIKENYRNILDASKHVMGDTAVAKTFAEWKQNNAKISWKTRTDEDKINIINSASGNGAIRDFKADTVKPYTASRIEEIKQLIAKPSEYDDLFKEAGEKYGVDPRELKLRAVVESGLKPSAEGKETPYGQSGGLMQLEAGTAKKLGVTDRNDPRQSVMAAAQLLAKHQKVSGGDQGMVDKLYYAGSKKNMGPNTEQYAANIAAVRGGADAGGFAKTGYEFDDLPLEDKVESLSKAKANITGKIFEIVNDPETDAPNKKLQIDTLELQGAITTQTAAQARRVIASRDAIDTITNTPAMADIITRIYDLNAIQEMDSAGYLTGVHNIREEIMAKQGSRELTASDALKLNNQLKTLTSAKMADATQRVGMEFYESQQKFEILPPEYRGRATRELFYKTNGKDNLSKEAYDIYAQDIVATINHERRTNTLKRIDIITMPDADFLKTNNITMDQVRQAAKNKNLSEAQVIKYLKAKLVNK